jgi:hypothetical protein
MKATPHGIKDRPEPNGSHMVQVRLETGDLVDVSFDPVNAAHFVKIFQQGMLERVAKNLETFEVAIAKLLDSGAGTNPSGPSVQVSISQIGLISLIASDEALLKLKKDIERALKMRAEKKKAN